MWMAQANTEGGEGGEAGAVATAAPDVAYLARLSLVDGHMRAAVLLYSKGMVDEAVGLSGHPEAEMMDEVRAGLAQHGATDFTPQLEELGTLMAEAAPQMSVNTAMSNLTAAIDAAAQAAHAPDRTQFQAITELVRAAAVEYQGSIEDGQIVDPLAYHESFGFIQVARDEVERLANGSDEGATIAARKILTSLDKTGAAFGDIMQNPPFVGDPSILYGVAAETELASLRVE
jgi:hypothetical protein